MRKRVKVEYVPYTEVLARDLKEGDVLGFLNPRWNRCIDGVEYPDVGQVLLRSRNIYTNEVEIDWYEAGQEVAIVKV